MSLSDVKVGRVGMGDSDVDEVVEIEIDATVGGVADELEAKVDMLKAAEIANDVAFDETADEVETAIEYWDGITAQEKRYLDSSWRFGKRHEPHAFDPDELERLMALKLDEFDREIKRIRLENGETNVAFGKGAELQQHRNAYDERQRRRAQKAAQDAQHQAGRNE